LRTCCLQTRHYPCRLRRHLEGCVHWPIWRAKVTERSMEPALRPGDCLLIRRTRRIRPGQVVVARHPDRPDMLLVKRAAPRAGGGGLVAGVGQPGGRRGGQPEVRGGTRAAHRGPGPGPLLAGALFTPERAGYPPPHTRTAPPGGGAVLGSC